MHFAGTVSKAGTMLIKANKSFNKLLIMHFAGTGSKAGTMLIKVNKFFNIHLLTVNECYMLSRLIKCEIKNTYFKYNVMAVKHKTHFKTAL